MIGKRDRYPNKDFIIATPADCTDVGNSPSRKIIFKKNDQITESNDVRKLGRRTRAVGKSSGSVRSQSGSCSKPRWRPEMDSILRRAFEIFGDNKPAIKALFPGFSERLILRKIGELKVGIARNEWLEKHDLLLVKGIV